MWVNVKDQFVFPARMAVAPLSRDAFVNAGYPPDFVFRLTDTPEFNEDLVRSLLYRTYGNQFNTASWQLNVVQYNPRCLCIDVVVGSPELEPTLPGYELKRLQPVEDSIEDDD